MASYFSSRETAMRQMQAAAQRAMQTKLTEIAESQEERLAMADKAKERGDVALAATIYLRLAATRPETESVLAARARFIALRKEGAKQLADVDQFLAQRNSQSANSDSDNYSETIFKGFEKYQMLVYQFAKVPGIGSKIRTHVNRQKRNPEFAAVLNEPEAHELFELGRSLEAKGQVCCAYHVYEKAKAIQHAPSAGFATERYGALSRDPEVVASAKACAELQWCHTTFDRANWMASISPSRAKKLYQEIAARAPEESTVYKAAIAKLANR